MKEPRLGRPSIFSHSFSLVPSYQKPGTCYFLSAYKTSKCMWGVCNQAVIVYKRNKTKTTILTIKYIVLWFQATIQDSLIVS